MGIDEMTWSSRKPTGNSPAGRYPDIIDDYYDVRITDIEVK